MTDGAGGLGFQPLVIIGAARSGTNILRDVLCAVPGFVTWPCDEINYIWRHGNVRFPSDELPPESATPPVRRYVRNAFRRLARTGGVEYVVEKTCANSLRVGFVDRVVPEAKYVFLTRDGADVVASAMRRWTADLDIPYLLRKARFVPTSDLPYYASRYLANRIHKLTSRDRKLASWGPRLDGMDEIVARHSLAEVCAIQWRASLDRADAALRELSPDRVHRLAYEDFVANPADHLVALAEFLGVEVAGGEARRMVAGVNSDSVGRGRAQLGPDTCATIAPYLSGEIRA